MGKDKIQMKAIIIIINNNKNKEVGIIGLYFKN